MQISSCQLGCALEKEGVSERQKSSKAVAGFMTNDHRVESGKPSVLLRPEKSLNSDTYDFSLASLELPSYVSWACYIQAQLGMILRAFKLAEQCWLSWRSTKSEPKALWRLEY